MLLRRHAGASLATPSLALGCGTLMSPELTPAPPASSWGSPGSFHRAALGRF